MSRNNDPARTCLHVRDWPRVDQALWEAALTPGCLEDDGGGAGWRPTTVETLRQGYGRWINYLIRSGADMKLPPARRVTPARVRGYLEELGDQGLSPQTRCNRISELMSVMKAFAPTDEWTWLKRRMNRLATLAEESRQQRVLPLLAGDVLDKAMKALKDTNRDDVCGDVLKAVTYRNWLIVAMLSLMPLRRHNFADLSIGKDFRRRGSDWFFDVAADDAKTAKPIVMPIPGNLHAHLQFYLDHVRPVLLAGRASVRLWISVRHTELNDHSFWVCITNFTRKEFGQAINPHRFRHVGATSIVMAEPEMMEAARAFLGHGNSQTTKDFYIVGQSLAASRQHAGLIRVLRRRLGSDHVEPAPEFRSGSRDENIDQRDAA